MWNQDIFRPKKKCIYYQENFIKYILWKKEKQASKKARDSSRDGEAKRKKKEMWVDLNNLGMHRAIRWCLMCEVKETKNRHHLIIGEYVA